MAKRNGDDDGNVKDIGAELTARRIGRRRRKRFKPWRKDYDLNPWELEQEGLRFKSIPGDLPGPSDLKKVLLDNGDLRPWTTTPPAVNIGVPGASSHAVGVPHRVLEHLAKHPDAKLSKTDVYVLNPGTGVWESYINVWQRGLGRNPPTEIVGPDAVPVGTSWAWRR